MGDGEGTFGAFPTRFYMEFTTFCFFAVVSLLVYVSRAAPTSLDTVHNKRGSQRRRAEGQSIYTMGGQNTVQGPYLACQLILSGLSATVDSLIRKACALCSSALLQPGQQL